MLRIFAGISEILRKLTRKAVIDEKSVKEILSDLKKILIQNDVEISLAEEFVKNVERKCLKKKIPKPFTLREYVLKTIYEELVKFLGKEPASLIGKKRIMLVGLFGSGKTTTAAKLATFLQKRGLKTALVCLDYHRAAAPQQLRELGEKIGARVFIDENRNPFELAKKVLNEKKFDSLIFDTAGRNALDKELAEELKKLGEIIKPDEVLLTIPADLGKVARKQAEEFNKLVGITGVIITRMDGTAKGGAALAACQATNAKVKFIGTGEKIEDFEIYDPKRFVSRLLGLGDLQTLLEKAKEAEIPEKVEKTMKEEFTLNEFMEQMESLLKMGSLSEIVKLVPGLATRIPDEELEKQEDKIKIYRAIIQSMTKEERRNPDIINASRIKRIAKGSGRKESEVRELLNQYHLMKKMLKKVTPSKLKRGVLKQFAKRFGFSF
jgi:signal recognition particle subunit SRP54